MIENILFCTHKMEEGGERDPLIPQDEDDAADDENTTQPFQPDDHSIPGLSGEEIPMTTFIRGREKFLNQLKHPSLRGVLIRESWI